MLNHDKYLYNIYALNGIQTNNYTEHKETLKYIYQNHENSRVKKLAISIYNEL